MTTLKSYNGVYEGDRISRIAFPMGGIGAGMIAFGRDGSAVPYFIEACAGYDE